MKGLKIKTKRWFFMFALLLILAMGLQKDAIFAQEKSELNIYGIYLGEDTKGDATLLESKGHGLLIDIGSASQTSRIVQQLNQIGITHVDVLFSHLHSDHMGATSASATVGLENLEAMGISIDTLYIPSTNLTPYSSRCSNRTSSIQNYVNGKPNMKIVYLNVGDQVQVGDAVGKVIGPVDSSTRMPNQYTEYISLENRNIIYENDSSLAMIFKCGNTQYFTAGDCYGREAKALVDTYGSGLQCDIMKLNHHGIGTGNSADLIKAIHPKYSFVPNSGVEKYSETTGRWRTYSATQRATKYGMCYMIGNEKKTIVYNIVNDQITVYQGSIVSKENKMTGWQYLYGADGLNRDHDLYYFNKDGSLARGIKKIGKHTYYFGEGGQMNYGTYNSEGIYSGWHSYSGKKRYFQLSANKKYAYMSTGIKQIGSETYYFDKNGYKQIPDILEDDNNIDEDIYPTKIGSSYYYLDEDGAMALDDWIEIAGDYYFFGKSGKMYYNNVYTISGDKYLFENDGTLVEGERKTELYDFKNSIYAVRVDGTLVCGKIAKIEGKRYYFNVQGKMQSNKIIHVGTHNYYFDKNGELVTNKKVKRNGKVYYSNKNGVLSTKKK